MSELIDKWAHVLDRVNIPTWTEVLTLAYLAELASKSEWIIECGTYLGATAKVMLLANPKLTLYCVDTFQCRNEPMMVDYMNAIGIVAQDSHTWTTGHICENYSLRQEIEEKRCKLCIGDSADASEHLIALRRFDAIWIDDGHATEDVLRDIRCLMPFLKSGGQMIGHDYDHTNDVAVGVQKSGIDFDVPIPRMWRHFKP